MLDFLNLSFQSAQNLSHELRTLPDPFLTYRRWMVGLSLFSIFCMALIGLFQMGIISHLPDLPFPYFNADRVDAAPAAYQTLGMPDAVLGLFSYSVTLALISIGGVDRSPFLVLLMSGKIVIDAFNALRLSHLQWADHRAFCIWCLIAALSTLVLVPLAFPETRWAIGKVFF